jgi:hypothetical protein
VAGATVIVETPGVCFVTVMLDGDADSVKPVGSALTTRESVVDVEVEKLASPLYSAVMEWVPTARDDVE